MKKEKLIEGIFGLLMKEESAKKLDLLMKTLPKECQTLKRKAINPSKFDLIPGERCDISVVSSEQAPDRDGDIVVCKNVDTTDFMKSPNVLFSHRMDEMPVGKCLWIKCVNTELLAKTFYPKKAPDFVGTWLPSMVLFYMQQGICKGKSLGFLPTKIRPPKKDEPQYKGATAIIESSLLLEYSVVGVPCNQNALMVAVSKGIADEVTLKRLGMIKDGKKEIEKEVNKLKEHEQVLKILNNFHIDANKMIENILKDLSNRGTI